jgi:hypothetical protein
MQKGFCPSCICIRAFHIVCEYAAKAHGDAVFKGVGMGYEVRVCMREGEVSTIGCLICEAYTA